MARFLNDLWAAVQNQRERWIFWTPVPVAFGVAFYFGLRGEPPLATGPVLLALLAPLLAAFYKNRPVFLTLLAVFLAVGGFTAAQWRTQQVAAPVLEKRSYAVTLRGKVVEVDPLPKTYRIVLEGIEVIDGKIWQDDLPRRVRIKLKNNDPAVPQAGSIVEIRAGLLPLSPPVMPGAFDFQRHAFFKGLGATGFAYGDLKVVRERAGSAFYFEKLRQSVREKISAAIADRDNAALLTAFMIGEDRGISEKDWEIARQSGIAHLIAISGSHFVLIAGFPFFLIRALLAAIPFIALRWPVKKIAAAGAMAVSIFYMLLIGAPVTAQRAVIMTCVVMTAVMFDRNPFTLRLAVFAAFVLFVFEPESVMGPSFQMSFAAVVALIAFYESTGPWWKNQFREAPWTKRYSLYLLGCFATTLVASAATAPFALYHFSRMPMLGGLAANMIAVPVSSFVTFPLGLFSCLLMPLGLETWPLRVTEKSLDVFMYVAEIVAGWDYAGVNVNGFAGWILAVMTLGMLWICIWRGRMRWLGMIPFALAALFIPLTPRAAVLVSDDGKLMAVRDAAGDLHFSMLGREKFVREQWTVREGNVKAAARAWPAAEDKQAAASPVTCKAGYCTYTLGKTVFAFVEGQESVAPACRAGASILVSAQDIRRARNCAAGAVVIGKYDLRREGAHAFYLRPDNSIDIQTVRGARGLRPWTPGGRKTG